MVQEIVPRDHSFMAQGETGTIYLNMFSPGGSQSPVVGSHTCIPYKCRKAQASVSEGIVRNKVSSIFPYNVKEFMEGIKGIQVYESNINSILIPLLFTHLRPSSCSAVTILKATPYRNNPIPS